MAALALAMPVAGIGLSAWSWSDPAAKESARRITDVTHGDLSDGALKRFAATLDPAAAALAQQLDPHAGLRFGAAAGWSDLDLVRKPDLGFDPNSAEEAERLNAAIPALADAVSAARPFAIPVSSPERARAVRCLTQAIYYEAALEPRAGQEAVAQVVLNRVRDPNFPASVCGVVFQGADQSTGCQFSFTCDGSMARAPVAWAWKNSQDVAERALNGYVAASVGTATHYHADYVAPYWRPTLIKLEQIGRHIFYRWRGQAGEAPAFTQAWRGNEPVIDEARYSRPRAAPVLQQIKDTAVTTVASDGTTRINTVIGGRRLASKEDIAKINASLKQFEANLEQPAAEPKPVAGVTAMAVEEVGQKTR